MTKKTSKKTRTSVASSKCLKKTPLIKLNEAYNKILNWFFSYPDKEISLSDLATNLKISKITANRIVAQLVKEEFLKLKVIGRVWRISSNKDHPYNYSRKISYNLMMVYESDIISSIHKLYENPKAIILFGSYRKGDDNEKSDIDIAVEIVGNDEVKIIELGIIPEFGFRKNVPVNLYVFSRNKVDANLFANIANGIVLEGFLETRP